MHFVTRLMFSSVLFISLFTGNNISAQEDIQTYKSALTILPSQKTSLSPNQAKGSLALQLSENDEGLNVLINFTPPPKEKSHTPEMVQGQAGGSLTLYLDGMQVTNQFFNDDNLALTHIIPFKDLRDGEHTIRATVQAGLPRQFQQEIHFRINSKPSINIQNAQTEQGLFDPMISLHFWGNEKDTAGYLEIHIDERLVTTTIIKTDQLHRFINLSKLLGTPVDIGALAQGEHLLRLQAMSLNGNNTVKYLPFKVDNTPKLTVEHNKDNQLQSITAKFAETSQGYSGWLELYFNQGVILSKQVRDAQITIAREELLESFVKYNHPITATMSVVIALRSQNGLEKWLETSF